MSSSKRSARGGEGQRPRRGSLLSDYTAAKTDAAETASGMIYFFIACLFANGHAHAADFKDI